MYLRTTAIDDIGRMLEQDKTFTEWPTWEAIGTRSLGQWKFVTGLAVDGIGLSGVRIIGTALQGTMDREVTVQMKALVGNHWLHICRLDYRPLGDHKNPLNRRDLRRKIDAGTSHVHRFADNVHGGSLDGLHPRSNLPAAVAIDPPPLSVRKFFVIVGETLGIPDFAHIDPPDWQGGLPL